MGRWRKIKRVIGVVLLHMVGIIPPLGYLYFSIEKANIKEQALICNAIEIEILDSLENRFITKAEVLNWLEEMNVIEGVTKISSLDLTLLEKELEEKQGVLKSVISYSSTGVLRVEVEQRRAIVRVEMGEYSFYIDSEGYIIPKANKVAYVPVINGNYPLPFPVGHYGYIDSGDSFLNGICNFALFLEEEVGWSKMIDQIESDKVGQLTFYPRVGGTKVIFGTLHNIEEKFTLLKEFYNKIVSLKGWDIYESVDIRYKDQLVCKKR